MNVWQCDGCKRLAHPIFPPATADGVTPDYDLPPTGLPNEQWYEGQVPFMMNDQTVVSFVRVFCDDCTLSILLAIDDLEGPS